MKFVSVGTLAVATFALGAAMAIGNERPAQVPRVLPECTWESARPITVEQLNGDYLALEGTCVRTNGVLSRDSFAADRSIFERYHFGQAGVFFDGPPPVDFEHIIFAEVLGVVGACEHLCPPPRPPVSHPGGSISIPPPCIPSGACHWLTEYAYLDVLEYRAEGPIEPRPQFRVLEKRVTTAAELRGAGKTR